jgi:hypothetical protein
MPSAAPPSAPNIRPRMASNAIFMAVFSHLEAHTRPG